MKRCLLALALISSALAGPALADDVAVSINIGQPGYYGPLDMSGRYPRPVLIFERPTVVQRVPVSRPPIYMYVPEKHARHWRAYCEQYNACGERVLFVRGDWYRNQYVPRYRDHYAGNDDWRREHRHERRHDRDWRDERWDGSRDRWDKG